MIEETFAMVKPDAFERRCRSVDRVARTVVGFVLVEIEHCKFDVVEARLVRPTRTLAEALYAEHAGKHFFEDLVEFTTSGSCLAMVLRREDAVAHWRRVLGAADSRQAEHGTLRYGYGDKSGNRIWANVAHGSKLGRGSGEGDRVVLPAVGCGPACADVIYAEHAGKHFFEDLVYLVEVR